MHVIGYAWKSQNNLRGLISCKLLCNYPCQTLNDQMFAKVKHQVSFKHYQDKARSAEFYSFHYPQHLDCLRWAFWNVNIMLS